MREPAFWQRPTSLQSRLLLPIAAIYGAIAARRMAQPGVSVGIPVICVGNYHVGGAGKTPTVLALAELLRQVGETPVVLSRGYGGTLKGPVGVDAERHTAAEVGDEPLMMARTISVVIARDRVVGAALARSQGASVVLMDDGFQNPALAKDASLIVIDGDRGLGNARVIPAGPLRAPLAPQLARTDALVIVGKGVAAKSIAAAITSRGGAVLRAALTPDDASLIALLGKRVMAFAGIGDPNRFFRTLRAGGITVVAEKVFPDHHPYSVRDVDALIAEAREQQLTLVTTDKDLTRLRTNRDTMASATQIIAFAVTLEFEDAPALRALIAERIRMARNGELNPTP